MHLQGVKGDVGDENGMKNEERLKRRGGNSYFKDTDVRLVDSSTVIQENEALVTFIRRSGRLLRFH